VQTPAVSRLLFRRDGVSDAADAGGSSTPTTIWRRVPSLSRTTRSRTALTGMIFSGPTRTDNAQFPYVRMRTEPDNFLHVGIGGVIVDVIVVFVVINDDDDDDDDDDNVVVVVRGVTKTTR